MSSTTKTLERTVPALPERAATEAAEAAQSTEVAEAAEAVEAVEVAGPRQVAEGRMGCSKIDSR